ncbi:MAG: GNAT family N-acetyltransferase [Alphaproteobacteria bacterium]|nr:MAG: GNAT family N-acetyltransferase [Alphaproteobacteria bacterium]
MTAAPAPGALLAAMEATWAPAARIALGPWTLRRGEGGGKRVSAATAQDAAAAAARIDEAAAAMRAMGQRPLFMLLPGQEALDAALAAQGYRIVDPVLVYHAPAEALAGLDPRGFHAIRCAAPLAIMRELWAAGGIGPGRLGVMARSGAARCFLLGRHRDRPAACGFVAAAGDVAMLHALHVAPDSRRAGMGRALTGAAAAWALEQGAPHLGLAVTEANLPARRLYEGLGMAARARYHYRALPEDEP